jgi:hypothetical protein
VNGTAQAPYVEQVSALKVDELGPGEVYLAAARFSLPPPPKRKDEADQRLGFSELRRMMRIGVLTRPEAQAIPGFPTAWEMVLGLTASRLVSWRTQKGTNLPGHLLGAVDLRDVAGVELMTLPLRRGRSLGVKFVLRGGPRVLLDVVAGFRADAEDLVDEAQRILG